LGWLEGGDYEETEWGGKLEKDMGLKLGVLPYMVFAKIPTLEYFFSLESEGSRSTFYYTFFFFN